MKENRRIVVASKFWVGSTASGITQGLRKLGWDICYVDMQPHFPESGQLPLRILSRVLRPVSIASYNQAILNAVRTMRPRAFLVTKGGYVTRRTLEDIKREGVMTLNYYTDFHFDYDDIDEEVFSTYDYFFTSKSHHIPYLQKYLDSSRVKLLHHGYSPDMHYPRMASVSDEDFVADCGYVGTCTPYKVRWLQALVERMPDVTLAVVGGGWDRLAKGTPVEKSVLGYQLVGDAYCRFVQQVRINLAFHMGPFGSRGWQDLVSMRTFEIPACKGFMLHIDNDEVRGLFRQGSEIDVFDDPTELCEKVRHYLGQSGLRRQMIERAFERCVPAYSYDNRARTIAGAIESKGEYSPDAT